MNRRHRIVHRRVIIRGDLVLQTATHLGDGDSEGATDMALLRDGREPEKVLLSGASIAGALRSYLREHLHGVFEAEHVHGITEVLFGGRKSDDEGYQSPLIVNDALAKPRTYELRDGVKIDGRTRTAADKAKYDLELIAAGTRFPLLFELAFVYQLDGHGEPIAPDAQRSYERQMLTGLATALNGLAQGNIGLGMKKRRGFGQCAVAEWQLWDFDLTRHDDLFAWLAFDPSTTSAPGVAHRTGTDMTTMLGASITVPQDQRQMLTLAVTCVLDGSLLIRSGQDAAVLAPDVRHLHALQPDGESRPIISGTSLAGVLRHRAERIANTLVPGTGEVFTNGMFGWVGASGRRAGDSGQASRVRVREAVIADAMTDLVQNRVGIDRFTGGALDGTLFNEQPVFAQSETRVTLTIDLFKPEAGEPAMLLLLLKDLWTGDLPIGGESSIGRGRLRGLSATFKSNGALIAEFSGDHAGVTLTQGDREELNMLVGQLPRALHGMVAQSTSPDKEVFNGPA
jgi:CRISPR/Cas system CSM-associated protein Csm3 (group 7 of RAMP superfamily)